MIREAIPAEDLKVCSSASERSFAEVAADLSSDVGVGLTSAEVQKRQLEHGSNLIRSNARLPAWRRLLTQFLDPQVALLLVAVTVSVAVSIMETSSPLSYEALIILVIVVLNAVLGFVQEDRAERALASLRKMTPAEATVIRDGRQQRILAEGIVLGDLIVIGEGDLIPADARLCRVQSFCTMEASLTGESVPVLKVIAPIQSGAAIGDRSNSVFAGTFAVSGNARAIVTAIGMQTEIGRIAELLESSEERLSPLQRQLRLLSKQLSIAVIMIAAVVVSTLLISQEVHNLNLLMEILLFGVALAVAATPEGLSAVITLVLALGVQRMARRGAIVRKLAAVETLGSTTVIACDKTGTLTCNQMTVRVLVTASGSADVSGSGYVPEGEITASSLGALAEAHWLEIQSLFLGAALANNAQLNMHGTEWTIQGDPTEAALLTAAQKAKILPEIVNGIYTRVAELPFSSERKMMSTVHQHRDVTESSVVFVKGAPDILLERCTHEFVAGTSHRLTAKRRDEIRTDNDRLTADALRTLGVATRVLLPHEAIKFESIDADIMETGLTFLGLVGMMDPPRPEAHDAIKRARGAGIRIVLITGDHPRTASAIARELDIALSERVLSGAECEEMSDTELAEVVRDTSVYARVNPEHKLRIVRALRHNGEIVAMTGDGVNDAPALKVADIGIAMGISGTDVSKQAADLILIDDNFATIVAAVEEGRVIYDNIQKFLRYLLATNLGEVLIIFICSILLSRRDTAFTNALVIPLSAAQILWINLVTDGAPALALGLDPAAEGIMLRRPRLVSEKIINYRMLADLCLVAIVMTVGTIAVFVFAINRKTVEYRQSMAFTTLLLFQLVNSLSARSESQSAFRKLFANRWLWGAICLSLGLQVSALGIPVLQRALGIVPLSISDWLLCISVASAILWVSEARKYFIRSRMSKEQHTLIRHQGEMAARRKNDKGNSVPLDTQVRLGGFDAVFDHSKCHYAVPPNAAPVSASTYRSSGSCDRHATPSPVGPLSPQK